MPKLVEWDKCCGCAACANKCAKQAIAMLPNEEGFLHPVVDEDLCVECKACEKVCPGIMAAKAEGNTPQAFIVQHKNDNIRYESAYVCNKDGNRLTTMHLVVGSLYI